MAVLSDGLAWTGPWPPYPGMHPAVFHGGDAMLILSIWGIDETLERIAEDLGRLFADLPEGDFAAIVHWGTAQEICDVLRGESGRRPVVLDLEGTSKVTQDVFARLMKDEGLIAVETKS